IGRLSMETDIAPVLADHRSKRLIICESIIRAQWGYAHGDQIQTDVPNLIKMLRARLSNANRKIHGTVNHINLRNFFQIIVTVRSLNIGCTASKGHIAPIPANGGVIGFTVKDPDGSSIRVPQD